MAPTEPKPLPRSLAAEGKAEPGAAENEQLYTESLPEHYRQKWEKEGISTRASGAEQQARTSLRAQVSLRRNIRRLLAKYGCPPDLSEDATQLVLKQAEGSAENGVV